MGWKYGGGWFYFDENDIEDYGFQDEITLDDIFNPEKVLNEQEEDTIESLINNVRDTIRTLKKKEMELEITIQYDFLDDLLD